MKEDLERVRAWAHEKTQSGNEPPWAWYQYMKLVEACDAILGGMSVTSPTGGLQQSACNSGVHLRLVDSTYPQENAPPHLDEPLPHLPM